MPEHQREINAIAGVETSFVGQTAAADDEEASSAEEEKALEQKSK